MGNDAQNPTPTTQPAAPSPFDAVPGHQVEPTIQAAPKSVWQAGPGGTAHAKGAGTGDFGSVDTDITGKLNSITEPIENYTQAGRAEHPILSKLGDVTRNVKEMLEGGQAAGKPMGTSSSPIMDTANTLGMAEDAAEYAPKVEAFVGEHAAPIASHLAETGRNFLTSLAEEGKAAFEAVHPEGREAEAGFAKIPGYKKEAPAPKKPKVTSAKTTNAKAEAKLAAARAGAAPDLEKSPTSIPAGAKTRKEVTHVDPNAFIDAVNPGGQTAKEDVVQHYQQKIRAGEELSPNKVEYDEHGKITGADGRHRAEASRREDVPLKIETNQVLRPGERPEENYVYRARTVGEKGVPSQSLAQATSDPEEAARIAADREKIEGAPQEVVKIPLHKLEEGDYTAKAHPNGSDWIKFNRDLGEHEVEPHVPATEESASAAPETTAPEEEQRYHPDLQKIVDKYGEHDDPYKVSHGASFITPEGKFVHLGSVEHTRAIEDVTGKMDGASDNRPDFLNSTGAVRTRVRTGRGGSELAISVPEGGVTHDQVDAIKGAARAAFADGKYGNIVLENAAGKTATPAEFANANNIEPMLREIGAHPDKETSVPAAAGRDFIKAKPKDYSKALSLNPHAATLSDFDPNAKAFQLTEDGEKKPVFYSIKPDGEIAGAVNNSGGQVKGALDAIMPHAIERGGNHLTAWDVNGKLPTMYAKYGFHVTENAPYDAAKYGAPTQQLLDSWKASGWKEGDPYPSVVSMALPKERTEVPGMTISTRQPSSVKYSTEDASRHNLRLTGDLINKNPALADKWADLVKTYPGFQAPEGADTQTTLNAFIEHAKDNLKHLYNSLPVEDQEKNKVWYDGAHTLTKELADQHGLTHPQAAGVVAALSPQKDWDQNVSLARRLTDIVKKQQNTVAGPDMLAKAQEIREASKTVKNPNANKYLVELAKSIQGKKLSDLSDVDKKAAFVRLYDEVNNPRRYFKINADGSNGGIFKKLDGTEGQVAWGGLDPISKAIDILGDGSRESLSNNLGQAHKVRHFYNNIIEPNSARGDVTVDTHAVAAALMRPLSGKSREVLANFDGPSSNVHGLNGTYPLYHEAYTRAAKELDIEHPRQLQSVVWEHIRNQFPAEFKTKENQDAINGIWKEAQNGKITTEDARKQILEYAQGHRVAADEGVQSPADTPELFGHGVHGESAGGHGRGDRGEHSMGNQTERPSERAKVKPAETSRSGGGDWAKILAEGDAKAKAARLKKK